MVHKRIFWASAFALTAALLVGCGPHGSEIAAAAPTVHAAVVRVQPTRLPEQVTVPGTVIRARVAKLASRQGGRVTAAPIEAGETAKRDALLLVVGAADARAQLAEARAQATATQAALIEARADERRYRTLYEEGAVSPREYQSIHRRYLSTQAAAQAAQEALAAARADLGYAELRAPFSGLLAERRVQAGDYAAPGETLAVLVGGPAQVLTEVGERVYRALRLGETADVQVADRHYPARVIQRVAAADPITRNHQIKLQLLEGPAPPYGAYAAVRVTLGETEALAIPASAVVERAGIHGVFVLDAEDRAHFRAVRLQPTANAELAVIGAGLAAGERVVADPSPTLGNGIRVQPVQNHD